MLTLKQQLLNLVREQDIIDNFHLLQDPLYLNKFDKLCTIEYIYSSAYAFKGIFLK